MSETTTGTTEAMENTTPDNPWLAAFEALEQKGEEAPETTEVEEGNGNAVSPDGKDAVETVGGDDPAHEGSVRGLDNPAGTDTEEGGVGTGNAFDIEVDDDYVKQYEERMNSEINDKVINDIAQEFIKRGARNRNGALGATLDDADICKRDEDGVPHFYNPETGREFTGDNPRRQAQEWCDDYNRELGRVFNEACQQYEDKLRKDYEPQLAVMKFKSKYDKLDDIRKGMFENVIQDYEIRDNDDKVIGYTCDLDKALALVERQVDMIRNYAKQHQGEQKPASTGPALDMKTSSGAVPSGDPQPPTSLAAAMEQIEDRKIANLKKN